MAKRWTVALVAGAAMSVSAVAETALDRYVAEEEDSFGWRVHAQHELAAGRAWVLELRSQKWRGRVWRHWLTLVKPKRLEHPGAALMLIAGGDKDTEPPDATGREAALLQRAVTEAGTWAVVLQQVPNQPLFEGLYEDDLIAHTFREYLDGGGETTPALLPMVKSAVAAMDAAQQFTGDRFDTALDRFTLTGASKRGWTSWLTAAVDDRVQAIAPIVFDMLRMEAQLKGQRSAYGRLSRKLEPYKERDIPQSLNTPAGERLRRIVDPFAYRERLTMPKLAVLGTNDPYWTLDAATRYAGSMPGPMHLYYQPNAGHEIRPRGAATIARFHKAVTADNAFPALAAKHPDDDPRRLRLTWKIDDAEPILWRADAPSRDFRDAEWRAKRLSSAESPHTVRVKRPESGHRAYYVELRFAFGTPVPGGVCSGVTILEGEAPATRPADAGSGE